MDTQSGIATGGIVVGTPTIGYLATVWGLKLAFFIILIVLVYFLLKRLFGISWKSVYCFLTGCTEEEYQKRLKDFEKQNKKSKKKKKKKKKKDEDEDEEDEDED